MGGKPNNDINIDAMSRFELIKFSKHAIKTNLNNYNQAKHGQIRANCIYDNFKKSTCINIIIGILFLFLYLYYNDQYFKYVYLIIGLTLIVYSLYLIYNIQKINDIKK